MAEQVTIFEVGPRDGLQNEPAQIATANKVRLVNLLSDCGLRRIEVTSFVSARQVPQMADGADVMAGISRRPGVVYAALTPNLRGYAAAKEARADEVAVFASASEGFSRSNINCSIAESFERFAPVIEAAKADGIAVRGYVSCIIACPFDGPVAPDAVASVAGRLIEAGCYEVSLGDTIGAGTPETVDVMLQAVLGRVPAKQLAGHFHDTRGRALENIFACLEREVRVFDAATGGLGGCQFAPGSAGNVATEAVVEMMEDAGFVTGVDAVRLFRAAAFAKGLRAAA